MKRTTKTLLSACVIGLIAFSTAEAQAAPPKAHCAFVKHRPHAKHHHADCLKKHALARKHII